MRFLVFLLGALLFTPTAEAGSVGYHTLSRQSDMFFDVATGRLHGIKRVSKFGGYGSVGTSFSALTATGTYPTPITETALYISSTSVSDTVGDIGAWSVVIEGIGGVSWTAISETVNLSGTTNVQLANKYTRVYRSYVSSTGTYATAMTGSHQGDITVGDLTTNWATINGSSVFPKGQSQIAAYTVQNGDRALVCDIVTHADTNKTTDILFFVREGANVTTPPYTAMRLKIELNASTHDDQLSPRTCVGPFVGPADMGFMARVNVGTADISSDFEILVLED